MAETPADPSPEEQFDTGYFDRLSAARDHWWVEGMRRVGEALLSEDRRGLAVLDAGCGSGALLGWLGDLASPRRVVGVDLAWPGLRYALVEGSAVLAQASVAALPFAAERFDLAASTDVLQHLTREQEQEALADLFRVLRPGGRVLVRTNCAFGRREVAERADWRLYTSGSLRRSLESAGFVVDAVTPANSLQALWVTVRSRAARKGASHHPAEEHEPADGERPEWAEAGLGIPHPVPAWENRALLSVLGAEARWVRGGRRSLPFGHSLYAVAHRP